MFSFRLDKIGNDQNMKTTFISIEEKYKPEELIICYENKTKEGISCKEHYHGVIKSSIEMTRVKSESMRDSFKKFLSKLGYEKTLSQVQIIKTHDEYSKALIYVSKQQQIAYTNLSIEQSQAILIASKEYNEEKKRPATFTAHQPEIFKILKNYYEKTGYCTRQNMLSEIFHYLYNWNKTNEEQHQISRPCNNTLLTFIQNSEFKLFPESQAKQIFMEECHNIIKYY